MDYGEKIQRLKIKGDRFLKENRKVFIIDIQDNWYYAEITSINNRQISIFNFEGKRKGQTDTLDWENVLDINEFKEREGESGDTI